MVSPPPPPPPPDAKHLAFAARLREFAQDADASELARLFEALESPEQGDPSVEPVVRDILGQLAGRDPHATRPQLVRWAQVGSLVQRSVAAVLLAELRDLRAVEPLLDICEKDRDPMGVMTPRATEAQRSLDTLAAANPAGFADDVIRRLSDAAGDRRRCLVLLLARAGDARVLPFLCAERDQACASGREVPLLLDAFGWVRHPAGVPVMLEAARVDDPHVLRSAEQALAAILSACVAQVQTAALEAVCRIRPRILLEKGLSMPFRASRRRVDFREARERAARELERRAVPVPPPDGTQRCAHCGEFFVGQDNEGALVNCYWHPGRLSDRADPEVAGTGRAGERWECCGFVLPTDGDLQRGGCAAGLHTVADAVRT